ncbi:cytochrome P450 [Aspergillus ambiguus]|uniref:cytochrome P450 n=1 Tax=Aspergillus ambiguus TaxID=176160 RepID=UPI003CCD8452
MAVSALTAVALVSFGVFFVYRVIVHPAFLSPLSKIPNAHWTAPISPAWILWKRFTSQNNRTIQAAHEKHGPIVRLSPSEISINCVENGIKSVYTGGFEKHDWYPRGFGSLGTVSMFTMTGSKPHSTRKRMMSNIYSKSFLQSSPHMRLISETVIFGRFLPIFQDAARTGKPLEVHDVNQGVTMDFVSAYLFGLSNGTRFLSDDAYRKKMLHLYHSRKPFEFFNQEVPGLLSWTKALGIRLIPRWCDDANDVLDQWNLELCDKAEASMHSTHIEAEPVVYKQLKQAMQKNPSGDDWPKLRIEIACELYDQLTAGFETSAVALTYLFWELSQHPELQKKLRAELLTLDPPIRFPTDSATLPPAKSVDSLPLLDAIVTETLRLHAPIPGIQPRVTPYPSCSLVGYADIPGNTRVNAQAYSLHRNPEVFPEPEAWLPQRWLKDSNSPAELEERKRWFWAFGSGGRMCVGSNLALQEIKLVIASVYTNFQTSILEDNDIEAIDAYTVKPQGEKLVLKIEQA